VGTIAFFLSLAEKCITSFLPVRGFPVVLEGSG